MEEKITLNEILTRSDSLVANQMVEIATVYAPSIKAPSLEPDEEGNYYKETHVGMQGGCFDGRYYYQAFMKYAFNETLKPNGERVFKGLVNDEYNLVVIAKYDVKLQKMVAVSKPYSLHHANDVTYNSKQGTLIICHNAPYPELLTYMDPETLVATKTEKIHDRIQGIHYNETYDKYVLGISGGYNLKITDSKFQEERFIEGSKRVHGFIKQGICCDDNYIYCLYYRPNHVGVYDWEGNFVTLIAFTADSEPESISVVDDKIYVICGNRNNKGTLYQLSDIQPKE